jgi:hypothetical protein
MIFGVCDSWKSVTSAEHFRRLQTYSGLTMRPIQLRTVLGAAFVTLISLLPLRAAGPIEANWHQICRVSEGRELVLTTATGDAVRGYCFSVDVDGLGVRTKGGQVTRIARTAVTRIEMESAAGHRLRALGGVMHDGLKLGVKTLFSEFAPVGLVVLPGTVAWGIIATPFCVLGDLGERGSGRQEIKLI